MQPRDAHTGIALRQPLCQQIRVGTVTIHSRKMVMSRCYLWELPTLHRYTAHTAPTAHAPMCTH
eukprot:3741-Heterococcus_DN1.PRE.4